ncbi:MAG: glycosyltransferase family 4 protein [Phycisphaeraceae bacterium]|nr:glycosyltransferase family 4 protein [Phycisphaeraceae bacterium]
MPWNMLAALQSAGFDVGDVLVDSVPSTLRRSRLPGVVRTAGIKRAAASIGRFARRLIPDRSYDSTMEEMRCLAAGVSRKIDAGGFDAVVAVNMSGLVSMIETSVPIIYATDATATLANTEYAVDAGRRRGIREAFLDFETRAVDRADLVLVPSAYCRDSMCRDHDADPSKLHLIPLGANLVPESDIDSAEISVPMSGGELELVVTAADPVRKRVTLCADVTEVLASRGWRARLHYVGPRHEICDRSIVEWAGRLNHGVASDRRRHREILRRAHLAILPSISEMYGIAPIESAAFGRPSIVSGVGGLTTVVQDGVTGRCLPVDTPVSGWADAVESMIIPAERYRACSAAALHRYHQELNWGAWGRRVGGLVEELVGN